MTSQPVASQPVHRSGALLDHLARRMRLRAESVLAPLGLRPRHLVALTVLRGRDGITQQALSVTLEMNRVRILKMLIASGREIDIEVPIDVAISEELRRDEADPAPFL